MALTVSIGLRMQQKRQQEGYSLRALGRTLGISFSTLARIERGEGLPDAHVRRRLEQWLHPETPVAPCHCPRCTGTSARLGWECPRCHRCYAPDWVSCLLCGFTAEGEAS